MEDVQEEFSELTSSNETTKKVDTDGESELPMLITDSDSDGSVWSLIGERASETSDTSDDDYLFNDSFSEDSSIADDDEYNVFEMLSHYFEMFSSSAPSFFGISLQMFYERLMESLEFEEEKDTPTPQHVLDSLPSMKVTIAQVASNLSCCVCFADYVMNEDILKLPCSHCYHKVCILDWLKIKSTCPSCRFDLSKHHDATINTTDLIRDSNFQYDNDSLDRSQNLTVAGAVDETDSNSSTTSVDVVKTDTYQAHASKKDAEKSESKTSTERPTDQTLRTRDPSLLTRDETLLTRDQSLRTRDPTLRTRDSVELRPSRSYVHVTRGGSYETEIW